MDLIRKDLIEKVSQLYLRYGIKSVTMDDVARHIGVSKKTLYSIVKDKTELVNCVVNVQIENHKRQDELFKDIKVSALEKMLMVFEHVSDILKNFNPSFQYDLNKYYPQLCEEFMSHKKENLFTDIKMNLIQGKKEGIYRKEINEDIIARMNTDRNMAMLNSDNQVNWFTTETFQEVFLYHIHAILSDKGRELLKEKNLFQNK